MADKKISELPLLNSVSGSTIVIPIVHDGTTVKLNLSQLAHYTSQFSAKTGSANTFTGNQTIVGNLVVSGDLTAERYYIETISSSVIYESGSTMFGNSGDDTHTFTGSIILNGATIGAAELNSFTASQLAVNLGISSVTGSINVQSASQDLVNLGISSVTGSINTTTASFDSVFLRISSVTGSINTTTASFDSVFLGISSVTGSLIGITNALMGFTASLDDTYATDAQLYQLYQATASIHFATSSLNTQTGSQDLVNRGISSVTGSINTTTSSFDSEFIKVGLTTSSIHFATQSLNTQTGSQYLVNLGISTFTGSIRAEIGGIEEYTASLKAAAIVSSSTQISNYYKFAETASANTFYGAINVLNSLTASLPEGYVWGGSVNNVSVLVATGSIVSQSAIANLGTTLYSNRPLTTNFSTLGSIFLGSGAGQNATNAQSSVFLGVQAGIDATNAQESFFVGNGAGAYSTNALRSNFIGISAGASSTGASLSNIIGYGAGGLATNATNANFLGNFTGYNGKNASYSTLIGYYVGSNVNGPGNGIGTNNIIIGTSITLENDRRDSINLGGIIFATGSYYSTSTTPYSGSVGNGRVGINKVLPQFSLDISGSVGVTGSFVVDGGITGSIMATNNVVSSSTQISNYYRFAETASANTFYGNQTFSGSFNVSGSTVQVGNNTLTGNTVLSGSINVSGSTTFNGTHSLVGNNTIAGNTVMSGSITVSGSSDFKNTLFIVTGSSYFTGSHFVDGNSIFSGSINIASGSSYYRAGNKLFNYGQWGSLETQSGSANTAYPMKLDIQYNGAEGIYVANNGSGFPTRLTIENTGLYNIQFSAQLHTTATEACDFSIWFAMTGSNMDNSNTDFSVEKISGGGFGLAALNLLTPITAGDYIELYWSNDTGNGQLQYKAPQSTPTRPATPSIIVTVTQIA